MKYLIVKGACGFGDRLQSLKMCVKYAIMNNLQIYVDWSDSVWSHNGESFYTYFKLVNMPVLNSIDDIPENATVYPSFWKGKLKTTLTVEMQLTPGINIGKLQDQQIAEDVIVYSSIGLRWTYTDSTFFGNVFRVIDPRIIQRVRARQDIYDLKSKLGVHLRGTDRATKISKPKRMEGVNIRLVGFGILGGTKCIAISDDPEFVQLWKARYKEFPVLTDVSNLGGPLGNHNKPKEATAVSKDTLNVDLLVDFFTLASCQSILSTSKDSRFAQEAQKLSRHTNVIIS
jgi:hypothetical protein